jgi:hypothetical protein
MTEFDTYLANLAQHEREKSRSLTSDPRNEILVNAGVRLNWLGDFFANPSIVWVKQTFDVNYIQFTGTNLEWNEILIKKCNRNPNEFIELINQHEEQRKKFENESSFDPNIPILVRKSDAVGKYKVLDGMHRFVGCILEGQITIEAYFSENEDNILPWCEPHVVYDLIRGYIRNAADEEGEKDLYHGLKLLLRAYGNVMDLLMNRFNTEYVDNEKVQKVIKKVLSD